MKRVFLLNSFTLNNNVDVVKSKIISYCKKNDIDYVIEINSVSLSTEDILEKYKNKKCIIIPIGGDGIINRTLNSIINTKNVLGYIPYGTGNDFNRTVIKQFKDGINNCDVIKVNDKYFINTLCFGIDAEIGNNKGNFNLKFIPKKQKYNLSIVAKLLKYKCRYFKVVSQNINQEMEYTTLIICNGGYYGGGYNVSPTGNLNDGVFEVFLVPKMNKLSMIKLILSMKNGKHIGSDKLTLVNEDKIKIESKEPIVANMDGEELQDTIFNIEMINSGIEVYYDKKLIKTLTKN